MPKSRKRPRWQTVGLLCPQICPRSFALVLGENTPGCLQEQRVPGALGKAGKPSLGSVCCPQIPCRASLSDPAHGRWGGQSNLIHDSKDNHKGLGLFLGKARDHGITGHWRQPGFCPKGQPWSGCRTRDQHTKINCFYTLG